MNIFVNSLKLVVLLSLTFLVSCTQSGSSWQKMQPAFGPVNQVNILMDKSLWEAKLGDTIRYYMETPYPILLQPEPQFDLRYISDEEFKTTNLIKRLRTYLFFVNIDDEDSEFTKMTKGFFGDAEIIPEGELYATKMARDRWAEGQILIFVIGKGEKGLAEAFNDYYSTLASTISNFDDGLTKKDVYVQGHNNVLNKEIASAFNLNVDLSGGFQKAIQNDTFAWYRDDQDASINNIQISIRDYVSTEQLKIEYLKEWINTISSKFIQGGIDGSYKVINDVDLPLLMETKTVNNHYTVILRGIWEMNNEFMGGTSVAYIFVDEQNRRLVLMEGFLLAPGEAKRNKMQRLEYIIKNSRMSGAG